jgi:hypothetical protein
MPDGHEVADGGLCRFARRGVGFVSLGRRAYCPPISGSGEREYDALRMVRSQLNWPGPKPGRREIGAEVR